jgi:hypothetical protein
MKTIPISTILLLALPLAAPAQSLSDRVSDLEKQSKETREQLDRIEALLMGRVQQPVRKPKQCACPDGASCQCNAGTTTPDEQLRRLREIISGLREIPVVPVLAPIPQPLPPLPPPPPQPSRPATRKATPRPSKPVEMASAPPQKPSRERVSWAANYTTCGCHNTGVGKQGMCVCHANGDHCDCTPVVPSVYKEATKPLVSPIYLPQVRYAIGPGT